MTSGDAGVDLFWIPLGAGGHLVRFCGIVFELVGAALAHRPRQALHHAALVVTVDGATYAIELAPAWSAAATDRGVVCTGPVGSRLLGVSRWFRYELRCWRGGRIPDLDFAVGGPRRLSSDAPAARRVLDAVAEVPSRVWGRAEPDTGDMWNSNSVVAFLLARAGLPAGELRPPAGGRAPGWRAGVAVAEQRGLATPGARVAGAQTTTITTAK